MSSVNFPTGMNDEARSMLKDMFGEPTAQDEMKALFDGELKMQQKKMIELANKARQPVEVNIHAPGEIIEMSDGTKYEVTPSGYWKKL